ncbi:MAG: DEAD/DEAH box helicase family protein, partial [Halobacteriales archaeon]|nr:DEAD/DEAH box helicase family protein [Halobacteriales archaeon]
LLFTEIYLDRLFRDPKQFVADINTTLDAFNKGKDGDDQLPGFVPSDLNKVCLWMATGAGKTLLMHVNILQYHHYLAAHGRSGEVNRVILLTPNEGLSNQHLGDLHESGFTRAELFRKDNQARLPNLGDTPIVEVIDIHKLDEEEGEKTVAIESFEANNLVLVDEGHTGASGDDWMDKRDRLCLDGFSFEYSATFGQAMKASKRKNLQDRYAKAVLLDYSYRYFYGDGYGKNYWILNLAGDVTEEVRKTYLTACLLTFYEQLRLFDDNREAVRPYRIERPLLVFVGGSVSAVRTESKRKVSDVLDILLFLADFCHDATASKARTPRRFALSANNTPTPWRSPTASSRRGSSTRSNAPIQRSSSSSAPRSSRKAGTASASAPSA